MISVSLITRALRFFGIDGYSPAQRDLHRELSSLSDRQLEDIGLTRGLIETVVVQGPAGVTPIIPEGAVQRVANTDRPIRAA